MAASAIRAQMCPAPPVRQEQNYRRARSRGYSPEPEPERLPRGWSRHRWLVGSQSLRAHQVVPTVLVTLTSPGLMSLTSVALTSPGLVSVAPVLAVSLA